MPGMVQAIVGAGEPGLAFRQRRLNFSYPPVDSGARIAIQPWQEPASHVECQAGVPERQGASLRVRGLGHLRVVELQKNLGGLHFVENEVERKPIRLRY